MVSFNDILQWSGNSLADAGNALIAASHKYEFASQELTDIRIDNFKGESAEAEAKKRRILADDAEDLWTQIAHSGNDLIDAAATADNIRESAISFKSMAIQRDMSIDDSGRVTSHSSDVPGRNNGVSGTAGKPSTDPETVKIYQTEADHIIERANDLIQFIESVCRDAICLKNTALAPRSEVVDRNMSEAPNPSWTTEDVNDWWTSLSPKDQQSIIDHHPEWIGNLNGIPMAARDQANRKRLPEMKKKIDEEVEKFEPKYEYVSEGTAEPTVLLNPEYKKLLEKQKDIHALERSINSDDSNNVGRTLLLLDDSRNDRIRAAVGSGDVDHAKHVIVNTQGMGSRVSTTLATEDGGRGSGVESTENIMDASGLSWRRQASGETAAGVTWLGYDAPSTPSINNIDVALPDHAEEGGRELAGFYDGIQTTHKGDPHLVAAGHSYGSATTGYALRQTTAPDDLVVWGSPGTSSVDASDLNMPSGNLYSASANDDPVASSGRFGGDPNTNSQSDFTRLDTQAHDGRTSSLGHTEYTNRGTNSVHEIGQVLRHDKPDYTLKRFSTPPAEKYEPRQ